VIGLEWHKAHLEAGRWEHVISDEVEARLVELLGNPATCPHGNPIPGASNSGGENRAQICLLDTHIGEVVRLGRITEEVELDTESLAYLYEHGFIPGNEATVVARENDGSMHLATGDATLTLGAGLCSQLYVSAGAEPVTTPPPGTATIGV
jgi:DtxR family Mn-dependent transcriptional regulator